MEACKEAQNTNRTPACGTSLY